jgi:putative ABC transport system ATP-binding protein
MINIRNLDFRYPAGEFHLQIPSFELEEGEKVAVIGPSGSGKTTLLNLIAGILKAPRGEVNVAGVSVDRQSDIGRRDMRITSIGFVFQEFELLEYLSVLDNIVHPFRITPALKLNADTFARATSLADELGIAHLLHRSPAELSQGEKQRAAIGRALLPEPRLILADEATGNLDPVNKGQVLDLLFNVAARRNTSLLAVTHDHDLLPRFDRVVDFADFRVAPGTS